MEITKQTMVGMSLATMLTFVGSIYMASGFIQGKIGMIEANASDIKQLEVKDVQDTLRSLRKEKRSLESELRRDPENDYIADDIGGVDDDIDFYEELLDCIRKELGECG